MKEGLKPFEVKITYTVAVLAKNERDAEDIASSELKDITTFESDPEYDVSEIKRMSRDWENYVPYARRGDNPDDLLLNQVFDEIKRVELEKEQAAKEVSDGEQLKIC